MNNILFVGGAGFIGSNLIKFIPNNYNIIVYEPPFANLSRLGENSNITIIKGALNEFDLLNSIILDYNIDVVVHLVSTLIPGSTYDDYKREFENVIFPSIKLMELCAERGIKFIYFSSGGTIYGNKPLGQCKETDLPAPISYYGLSKQILENSILFEHRKGGLKYLIIRPSNPFGPGQTLNGTQGLIAVSLGKILAKENIKVWGDGSSIRDYIYITDLGKIFSQLVEKNIENKILNIGSGKGYSINNIISYLECTVSETVNVEYVHSRSVDVSAVVLDISLLKSCIDICLTPIEKGISDFYLYIKETIKQE